MSDYPRREVFDRAPLEFVACEIRVPTAPRLVHTETFEKLTDQLRSVLPIPDEEQVQTVTLAGGGPSGVDNERRFRFLNRERTASALVARNSITVETTNYNEFADFRSLVLQVIEAVRSTVDVVGIERIGLRYVDEVRVSAQIENSRDWRGWISDDILGVLNLTEGYEDEGFQTVLRIAGQDSTGFVVRYAALNGDGVVGDGPLRRRSTSPGGPFFVIDTDSFRMSSGSQMEAFDRDTVGRVLDVVHEPIGIVFHRSITDRLREEFRS